MTKKEKQLLLNDLCARLPYGTKVYMKIKDCPYRDGTLCYQFLEEFQFKQGWNFCVEDIKPYLRSMSSMTEEEYEEWGELFYLPFAAGQSATSFEVYNDVIADFGWRQEIPISEIAEMINWLNAHHFDYRGFIERGLALEAPEGMYK